MNALLEELKQADVFLLPVDKLRPNSWNPNRMSAVAWDALGQSIRKHGIHLQPLVVRPIDDSFQILDGEHRYKWAKELKIEELPCIVYETDDFNAKKLTQILNRTRGEDDPARLKELFDSLLVDYSADEVIDGLPIASCEELDKLLEGLEASIDERYGLTDLQVNEGLTDQDAIPEDIETRVKKGDIWQLGRHRVMCGNSTVITDVERLMGGAIAEMCFTSPPYSVMRQYEEGTNISIGYLSEIFGTWLNNCNYFVINLGLQFKDGEVVQYWDEWIKAAKDKGLKLLAWNVWDKQQMGSVASATNMFGLTHEWLFVFGESRKRLNRTVPNQLEKYASRRGDNFLEGIPTNAREFDGSISISTSKAYTHHQIHSVVQVYYERSNIRNLHPATMPVGLPEQYIEAMTDNAQIVVDCFLGSGTTLIAAEKTGRTCYGMELSEKYCDVIIKRWEDFTGQTAEKLS